MTEARSAEWYEQQLANYRRELDEVNPQLDAARQSIRDMEAEVQRANDGVQQIAAVNQMQAAQIDGLQQQLASARQNHAATAESLTAANRRLTAMEKANERLLAVARESAQLASTFVAHAMDCINASETE